MTFKLNEADIEAHPAPTRPQNPIYKQTTTQPAASAKRSLSATPSLVIDLTQAWPTQPTKIRLYRKCIELR